VIEKSLLGGERAQRKNGATRRDGARWSTDGAPQAGHVAVAILPPSSGAEAILTQSPHAVNGRALGAALANALLERCWVEGQPSDRGLCVTSTGRLELNRLGVALDLTT